MFPSPLSLAFDTVHGGTMASTSSPHPSAFAQHHLPQIYRCLHQSPLQNTGSFLPESPENTHGLSEALIAEDSASAATMTAYSDAQVTQVVGHEASSLPTHMDEGSTSSPAGVQRTPPMPEFLEHSFHFPDDNPSTLGDGASSLLAKRAPADHTDTAASAAAAAAHTGGAGSAAVAVAAGGESHSAASAIPIMSFLSPFQQSSVCPQNMSFSLLSVSSAPLLSACARSRLRREICSFTSAASEDPVTSNNNSRQTNTGGDTAVFGEMDAPLTIFRRPTTATDSSTTRLSHAEDSESFYDYFQRKVFSVKSSVLPPNTTSAAAAVSTTAVAEDQSPVVPSDEAAAAAAVCLDEDHPQWGTADALYVAQDPFSQMPLVEASLAPPSDTEAADAEAKNIYTAAEVITPQANTAADDHIYDSMAASDRLESNSQTAAGEENATISPMPEEKEEAEKKDLEDLATATSTKPKKHVVIGGEEVCGDRSEGLLSSCTTFLSSWLSRTSVKPALHPPATHNWGLLWILLPYMLLLIAIALGTFVATHRVTQGTIAEALLEMHSYLRAEALVSMEELASLPVMATEGLAHLYVSDPTSTSATDESLPKSEGMTRILCAALRFSGLFNVVSNLGYGTLGGNKEWALCLHGGPHEHLGGVASIEDDPVASPPSRPHVHKWIYEMNLDTLTFQQPLKPLGQFIHALSVDDLLEYSGTGAVMEQWWNTVRPSNLSDVQMQHHQKQQQQQGSAVAMPRANYWRTIRRGLPSIVFTYPFIEANYTMPSQLFSRVESSRLLDGLKSLEGSVLQDARVMLIGGDSSVYMGQSISPIVIACSWCQASASTQSPQNRHLWSTPTSDLPSEWVYDPNEVTDELMRTGLTYIDVNQYVQYAFQHMTSYSDNLASDGAVELQEAAGKVYRHAHREFSYAGSTATISISVVRTHSDFTAVLVIATPGNILEETDTFGIQWQYYISLLVAAATALASFAVYYTLVWGLRAPLQVALQELKEALDIYERGDLASVSPDPEVTRSPEMQSPGMGLLDFLGYHCRVTFSETYAVQVLCSELQQRMADIRNYLPSGFVLPNIDTTEKDTYSDWFHRINTMSDMSAADTSAAQAVAENVHNTVNKSTFFVRDEKRRVKKQHMDDKSVLEVVLSDDDANSTVAAESNDNSIDMSLSGGASPAGPIPLSPEGGGGAAVQDNNFMSQYLLASPTSRSFSHNLGSTLTDPASRAVAAVAPSPANSSGCTRITNWYTKCFCSMLCMHVSMERGRTALQYMPGIMEVMMDCTHKYGGVVDIFVPEMLYISFGSRRRMTDHAVRATECALEMYSRLNPEALEFITFVIDCGVYNVGICGVPERKGYVLWGRPSGELFMRQQLLFGFRFIVMDTLVPLIRHRFRALPIDCVRISEEKGSPEVVLYALLLGSVNTPEWKYFSLRFNESFHHLTAGHFKLATPILEELRSSPIFPFYGVYYMFMSHLQELLESRGTVTQDELSRRINEINVTYAQELTSGSSLTMPFGCSSPFYISSPDYALYQPPAPHPAAAEDTVTETGGSEMGALSSTRDTNAAVAAAAPTACYDAVEDDQSNYTSAGSLVGSLVGADETTTSSLSPQRGASTKKTTHQPPVLTLVDSMYPDIPDTMEDVNQTVWRRSVKSYGEDFNSTSFIGMSNTGAIGFITLFQQQREFTGIGMSMSVLGTCSTISHPDDMMLDDTRGLPIGEAAYRAPMVPAFSNGSQGDQPPIVNLECINAIQSFYHANIAQFFSVAVIKDSPFFAIITEHVPGGTLREAVERFGRPLPLGAIRRYCVSMLRALEYLHKEKNVIHGLLGPDKVLVGEAGSCKITGMSYFFAWADNDPELRARLEKDAACFRSPEVNAGFPKTPASDIYSFGLILLGMLTGSLSPPWTWAGTPMGVPGRSVELDALLANNKLFIEALEEGVIELKQYGFARNNYNRSLRKRFPSSTTRSSVKDSSESATSSYHHCALTSTTAVQDVKKGPLADDSMAGNAGGAAAAAADADCTTVASLGGQGLSNASTRSTKEVTDEFSSFDVRGGTSEDTRDQLSAGDMEDSALDSILSTVAADAGMLRVLEGCLACAPENRRSASDLLQMLRDRIAL